MLPLFIPSPAHGVAYLGPIPIRGYAMSILAGIIAAFFLALHRWRKLGEAGERFENIALVAIVAGIVGARVYWVVIEWNRYFGTGHTEPWYHIFYTWEGGLGIWGAILFGFGTAWLMCRHYRVPFLRLADVVAPAFLMAQAVGRLGNYWNQELYGRPTTLPWGLEIDLAHRVAGFEQYATFHPTFLYEMIWNLLGVAVLLFVLEKKLHFGRGKLFASYIIWYATGRFCVELLRIDPVDSYFGLRVNAWYTLVGWLFGVVLLIVLIKRRPGANEVKPSAANHTEPALEAVDDAKTDIDHTASDQKNETEEPAA